jgi:nucleoid DNA-binding protein
MTKGDYNAVIKRVAKKMDIPEYKVWEVVHSVCRFITKEIESGNWDGFYMRFFGKFVVKPKRLEYMQAKIEKMIEKAKEDPLNLTSDE